MSNWSESIGKRMWVKAGAQWRRRADWCVSAVSTLILLYRTARAAATRDLYCVPHIHLRWCRIASGAPRQWQWLSRVWAARRYALENLECGRYYCKRVLEADDACVCSNVIRLRTTVEVDYDCTAKPPNRIYIYILVIFVYYRIEWVHAYQPSTDWSIFINCDVNSMDCW